MAQRKAWLKSNPPNFQGYYECYLCGRWVRQNEMELDHVKSVGRHPDMRFITENLKPSCHKCNTEKGSHDAE